MLPNFTLLDYDASPSSDVTSKLISPDFHSTDFISIRCKSPISSFEVFPAGPVMDGTIVYLKLEVSIWGRNFESNENLKGEIWIPIAFEEKRGMLVGLSSV